ncbi:MAG: methionyl-tRNA formyltransferase [Bacteroidota bacterium]
MSLKIVFMGTPDFAVPSLEILHRNGYDIVGVITATDKRGGRGKKKLMESAVKQYAVANGLRVLQPRNLKAPEFVEELRSLQADLQVVVAFRMLPVVVWDMPPLGTINLHGSLLPKYRGAAPIHWAVIKGEKETGVTSFFLKHKIDTGDLLFSDRLLIDEEDTTGDVHDRMMHLGAGVVLKSVNAIAEGDYTLQPQEDSEATKAPKLFHEDCEIDFARPTEEVYNLIRGLSPFPTAWMTLDGEELKIYKAGKVVADHEFLPGSIHTDHKTYLSFATNDGFINVLDLKLQGRRRMDIKDFLNGYKFKD